MKLCPAYLDASTNYGESAEMMRQRGKQFLAERDAMRSRLHGHIGLDHQFVAAIETVIEELDQTGKRWLVRASEAEGGAA